MIICREELMGYVVYDSSTRQWTLSAAKPERYDTFMPLDREMTRTDILRGPVRVYFELNKRCNLSCRHCFVSHEGALRDGLPREDIFRILDELRQLGAIVVRFTGGEITLREDFVELLAYALGNGFVTSINTNGCYTDPDRTIRQISSLPLRQVTISIDGDQSRHDAIRGQGTFARAMSTARELKNRGCAIRSNTVVTKHTLSSIEAFIDEHSELFGEMNFFAMRPLGRGIAMSDDALNFEDIFKLSLRFQALKKVYRNIEFEETAAVDLKNAEKEWPELYAATGFPIKVSTFNVSSDGRYWAHGYLPYIDERACYGAYTTHRVMDLWRHSVVVDRYRSWCGQMCARCKDCGEMGRRCPGYHVEEILGESVLGTKNRACIYSRESIKPWWLW